MGLSPPLKGTDELWISPDSRLEKNVVKTSIPEPSVSHLLAFTHESILGNEILTNRIKSISFQSLLIILGVFFFFKKSGKCALKNWKISTEIKWMLLSKDKLHN